MPAATSVNALIAREIENVASGASYDAASSECPAGAVR